MLRVFDDPQDTVDGPNTYRALTYSGALPFFAASLMPYIGIDSLGPLGPWDRILALYGLAIVAFLAGTHWTFALARPGAFGLPLMVISNVVVIFVWLAVLAGSGIQALGAELLAFLALLAIDRTVHRQGASSADYWRLRRNITLLVVVALLLGMLAAWRA